MSAHVNQNNHYGITSLAEIHKATDLRSASNQAFSAAGEDPKRKAELSGFLVASALKGTMDMNQTLENSSKSLEKQDMIIASLAKAMQGFTSIEDILHFLNMMLDSFKEKGGDYQKVADWLKSQLGAGQGTLDLKDLEQNFFWQAMEDYLKNPNGPYKSAFQQNTDSGSDFNGNSWNRHNIKVNKSGFFRAFAKDLEDKYGFHYGVNTLEANDNGFIDHFISSNPSDGYNLRETYFYNAGGVEHWTTGQDAIDGNRETAKENFDRLEKPIAQKILANSKLSGEKAGESVAQFAEAFRADVQEENTISNILHNLVFAGEGDNG